MIMTAAFGGAALVLHGQAQAGSSRVGTAELQISGPYRHDNLIVFLLHGDDALRGKSYLTLEEALRDKRVVVHETGDVQELAIENVSSAEVYVQAGDIVKGGRQDRVLQVDLILPPRSGKVPIASFCVEQGRWSRRGAESAVMFDDAAHALSSKDLKMAAKRDRSQGDVWREVSESQDKLSAALRADVAAPASPTSLRLTLENREVKQGAEGYVRALSDIIHRRKDSIGYAFAINGKLNSADVYGSSHLFQKMWPKMLRAAAVEAMAEKSAAAGSPEIDPTSVRALLARPAGEGSPRRHEVSGRVERVTQERKDAVVFETVERESGTLVHVNYLTR
jgi:hypothetical protein